VLRMLFDILNMSRLVSLRFPAPPPAVAYSGTAIHSHLLPFRNKSQAL